MRLAGLCVAAVILGGAAAALARDDAGLRAAFPVAPDGPFVAAPAVRLAGQPGLTLRSIRFRQLLPDGRPRAVLSCGVVLEARRRPPQAMVTIGEGRTEVPHCHRLREAGILPSPAGTARLGLIYEASSPNAEGRALVILRRDGAAGSWNTEDDLADQVEQRLPVLTLARVRARLRALGR
ncbi:hypothetical protein [Plastoroseomonas arctica]|uniref:Uncharacterized protein n=1 Tax=Plastoroseomonas arctica TaxID=1509237 RepID=A0AAF1K0B5_9PROT|nr:hypothetical protein [Plastoroseomonas arctica]MBR0653855.1 hypothetical protein [Plastoroseomonas arctica]